jgi:hypothetical protein
LFFLSVIKWWGVFTLLLEISKPTSTTSCSIPTGDSTTISFAISLE